MKRILQLFVTMLLLLVMISCNNGGKEPVGPFEVNGHEYVDLGLSVKWATCNIGAEYPEEYGDYFAWGDVVEGDGIISSYKWLVNDEIRMYSKYWIEDYGSADNKYMLEPIDDVANQKWGADWRMPTSKEVEELLTRCKWYLVELEDVMGYKVKGPNGNSIFLPLAGAIYKGDEYFVGAGGFYWSSSLYTEDSLLSCFLGCDTERQSIAYAERYVAQSVRPVIP